MKKIMILFLCCSHLLNCEQDKGLFNVEVEPLSLDATVKVSAWIGYQDFSYELKNLIDYFHEMKSVQEDEKLLSAAQAVLYSMPNDMRSDIMNEKATELVNHTKALYNGMTAKSEGEITQDIQKIVNTYIALNKEINDYMNN